MSRQQARYFPKGGGLRADFPGADSRASLWRGLAYEASATKMIGPEAGVTPSRGSSRIEQRLLNLSRVSEHQARRAKAHADQHEEF